MMRMLQRGITKEEIEIVLNQGWEVKDAKEGTLGRAFVFPHNQDWEGTLQEEKEVTVYYKIKGGRTILLTAIARYGKGFIRGGEKQ